ncbi:hypothetical protein [Mesorhizobium sp. J8]|uniref:hypothetical protein n=1 Tax=Mesorhizobium sp. J8 TaxID=2777475 RepID=UPI0019167956|nr:hypothetical protein [Mesorhizobium sp. J8]
MDFLKKLLILAVVSAVGAGVVAHLERLMFETPKPAAFGDQLPPPDVKKAPTPKWQWPSAG